MPWMVNLQINSWVLKNAKITYLLEINKRVVLALQTNNNRWSKNILKPVAIK